MKSRRKFGADLKAKVAIAAIKEQMTTAELAKKHGIHPSQITAWKKEFLANASSVFENNQERKSQEADLEKEKEQLYSKIGQLQVEVDFLKKALS